MRAQVDLFEVLRRDLRVDLRRRQIRMPEQQLHDAQVGPASQQVCGEGVPQRVRVHGLGDACRLRGQLDGALDRARIDMVAPVGAGAVAGLVAITPAAGNVGIGGGVVIGFIAGFACLWGVNGLKKLLGADDSLDVFGVHGVGGILGALLTGVFNSPSLGGPGFVADWVTATMVTPADFSIGAQVWVQAKAVLVTVVWSTVVSVIAYKLVDLTIGLRVTEEEEREGLDITSHGESAYHG